MKRSIVMLCCVQSGLWAQEASSGFELRATISEGASYSHELEEAPRSGSPLTGGFRSVLYPTWKLNKHWAVSGAIQTHSRPYFFEEFYTQGYGVKTDILQSELLEILDERLRRRSRGPVVFCSRLVSLAIRRCGEPAD